VGKACCSARQGVRGGARRAYVLTHSLSDPSLPSVLPKHAWRTIAASLEPVDAHTDERARRERKERQTIERNFEKLRNQQTGRGGLLNPTFPTRRKNRMNSMGAYRRSSLQGGGREASSCCCDAWVWLWRQIERRRSRSTTAPGGDFVDEDVLLWYTPRGRRPLRGLFCCTRRRVDPVAAPGSRSAALHRLQPGPPAWRYPE
jgi:hypothetical protein